MLDEETLAALDRDSEAQSLGRSAVVRAALHEWLRRRRRSSTDDAYRRGYAAPPAGGLGEEWSGWEEEGTWPAE